VTAVRVLLRRYFVTAKETEQQSDNDHASEPKLWFQEVSFREFVHEVLSIN
jgi:hypothetical protein